MRSELEIEELMDAANERAHQASEWPGMSYEEGVRDALAWVVGAVQEDPFDDEL